MTTPLIVKGGYTWNEPAYPESLPKIEGVELDVNLKHNYRSPYLNNEVGSDVMTVRYGDRT